jgi:hypothetical protein
LAVTAKGALPSVFCVTDLATATIGAAILAIAELASLRTGSFPAGQVDRRLASLWFEASLRPWGGRCRWHGTKKLGARFFLRGPGCPLRTRYLKLSPALYREASTRPRAGEAAEGGMRGKQSRLQSST